MKDYRRFGFAPDPAEWTRELMGTGRALPGEPDARTQWTTWGQLKSQSQLFTAGDEPHDLVAAQLIQAEFPRPLAWMVGLHLSQTSGLVNPPTFIVTFRLTFGLGSTRYVHEEIVQLSSAKNAVVVNYGPVPAESIVCDALIHVVSASVGTFPKTIGFNVGAFAAPQVW